MTKKLTLSLLLIFSLFTQTASSYAYLAQAKKVFTDAGKNLKTKLGFSHKTVIPKKAIPKNSNKKLNIKISNKSQLRNILQVSLKSLKFYSIACACAISIPILMLIIIIMLFAIGIHAPGIVGAPMLIAASLLAIPTLIIIPLAIITLIPAFIMFAITLKLIIHITNIITHPLLNYTNKKRLLRDLANPSITKLEKINLVLKQEQGFINIAKEFLSKLDNINADYNHHNGYTPLHIAAQYRFMTNENYKLALVKWMVEEKFANVFSVDYFGKTPGRSAFDAETRQYLAEKGYQQVYLIDEVDDLKNSLDNNEIKEVLATLHEEFVEIKEIIENPETPGYAKMLVLPTLVQMWQDHKATCKKYKICTENDIISFYKHIPFNQEFLKEYQFRPAIDFAKNKNITDMNGNTIFEAKLINGTEETYNKTVSLTIETTREFYKTENALKNWLAKQPTPKNTFTKIASPFISIKNKIFRNNTPINDKTTIKRTIPEQYGRALNITKAKKNKKRFRGLINPLLVKAKLRNNTELPDEVVGQIMGFAGTDFGNKLHI